MDGLDQRRTLDTPVVTIYQQCQHGASGSVMVGRAVGYWWLDRLGLRIIQLDLAANRAASEAVIAALLVGSIKDVVAAEQDAAAESPL